MFTKVNFFVLFGLMLMACATTPQRMVVMEAVGPGPEFGVSVDENHRVVGIELKSAAEAAGIQIGDILVDATWLRSEVPTDVPDSNDSASLGAGTSPLVEGEVVTGSVAMPAATQSIEELAKFIPTETIPFTEGTRIRELRSYGVPMLLTIVRGDQEIKLTVTPTPRVGRLGEPTVTPVMPPYDYF
jgi:hypothetical protein